MNENDDWLHEAYSHMSVYREWQIAWDNLMLYLLATSAGVVVRMVRVLLWMSE